MHIVLDGRYIRTENHDGISRFSANLIAGVARLIERRSDIALTILLSAAAQRAKIPYDGDLTCVVISPPTSPREPFVSRQINKLRPDIVFSPMQTMGTWGRKFRVVLTIHDLIYYRHRTPPREFSLLIRGLWRLYHLAWWPQRILLRRADAVVTVSNTTRDLIRQHRLTTRPVYVVPNATERPTTKTVMMFSKRQPICVYMGSFMPYKNVDTLVLAAGLLPTIEFHMLSRISEEQKQRLTSLSPNANVVFHNGCTDDEYADILSKATALVSASRDEGFGIPLVEAMTLGTPTVVSDIPIFREIGGDAAKFASPDSPAEFATAISQLLSEKEWTYRSRLAIAQSRRFNWQDSAKQLLDVLIDVVDPKPVSERSQSL